MTIDHPKCILILDDSKVVLEASKKYLEDAGFKVLTANDLGEFEKHHKNGSIDLMLLDVQMPELYGDDVGMVLRSQRDKSVKIWLFSSLDDAELEMRASEAEVDGYISKRRGLPAMLERVREILAES